MADIINNQKNTVGIENITTGNDLVVNSDGSINVAISVPPAPNNATPINISAFGNVASTTGVDTYYTITNGLTLTIQTVIAGAEYDSAGSVVELFYDPNGNLTTLIRVSTLYVNGQSISTPVQQIFIGNGTRRMVLRRRGFGSNGREMFGQWIGYEE